MSLTFDLSEVGRSVLRAPKHQNARLQAAEAETGACGSALGPLLLLLLVSHRYFSGLEDVLNNCAS